MEQQQIKPQFALFRLEKLTEHHPMGCFPHGMGISIRSLMGGCDFPDRPEIPDIPAKIEDQKKVWSLVGVCETPAQLAQLVRRDPLGQYAVMTGELKPIKIHMPVYMEGHNLDQLEKEW